MSDEAFTEGNEAVTKEPTKTLDLTHDTPPEGELDRFSIKPFDPEPGREKVRGWMAAGLLVLLALVVLGVVAAALFKRPDVRDVLNLVLTPVVGLTGTVVGFYFGGNKG